MHADNQPDVLILWRALWSCFDLGDEIWLRFQRACARLLSCHFLHFSLVADPLNDQTKGVSKKKKTNIKILGNRIMIVVGLLKSGKVRLRRTIDRV